MPAAERLFAELPQKLSGCFVQSPAGCYFVSGIGFLPNHCIRPQLSHINVAAVRLAQSNPRSVIPEVFNMAEPLRNFMFLQWLHTISSSPILYSQDFFSDMASTTFYIDATSAYTQMLLSEPIAIRFGLPVVFQTNIWSRIFYN
jgi:hypothetical protein